MNELLIGYARVSTYEHDLTAQRVALERLGYIFTDHGLTGTRPRNGASRTGRFRALPRIRGGPHPSQTGLNSRSDPTRHARKL
jgi:DNA invertase Pin-like site-specific DNA recombinase